MAAIPVLDAGHVRDTLGRLVLRINDRFPDSGLGRVCSGIFDLALQMEANLERLHRPIWWLRISMATVILCFVGLVTYALTRLDPGPGLGLIEVIQTSEAAANELIFLGMAIYFLWSLDMRIRRRRALERINQLRELAHVIDMHQLTKDPDGVRVVSQRTEHSPKRGMTDHELGRYLDYCSEMLALLSKLGAIYTARFDDSQVLEAASDLEDLCTGLSRKVWQKIMILRRA